MKKIGIGLGIGAGLLAIAAIVMAQTPPPGGPSNTPYYGGPPGQSGQDGPPGPGGPGRGPGFGPPMMLPPPTKGAEFRLGDGTRKIFIKCADDDSTKLCMDAIGPLLNKLIDMK
jgi:hypothetical protein